MLIPLEFSRGHARTTELEPHDEWMHRRRTSSADPEHTSTQRDLSLPSNLAITSWEARHRPKGFFDDTLTVAAPIKALGGLSCLADFALSAVQLTRPHPPMLVFAAQDLRRGARSSDCRKQPKAGRAGPGHAGQATARKRA